MILYDKRRWSGISLHHEQDEWFYIICASFTLANAYACIVSTHWHYGIFFQADEQTRKRHSKKSGASNQKFMGDS